MLESGLSQKVSQISDPREVSQISRISHLEVALPSMGTRSNPFRPTFGVPPLYWVGRTAVLDAFRNAL